MRAPPSMIPRISGLSDVQSVTVENSSDACFACDEEGGEWIRKREVNTGCEPLLAEALGWLLARRLGVPVPDAAVCLDRDERSWLSRRIPDVVHWDPENIAQIANLADLGAMLVLDVLLLNEDRHGGNILLKPDPDALHLRLWTIDMGNAVAGYPEDFEARTNDLPHARNLARHLPFAMLAQRAHQTAQAATALAEDELRSYVTEACLIAREAAVERLLGTVLSRCRNAEALLTGYLDERGVR